MSTWSRRVLLCRQSVLGYFRVCGGSHEGMQLKVPFSQFAYRGIMESWQKVMSMVVSECVDSSRCLSIHGSDHQAGSHQVSVYK